MYVVLYKIENYICFVFVVVITIFMSVESLKYTYANMSEINFFEN